MSIGLSDGFTLERDLKSRLAANPKYVLLVQGDTIDNMHNTYLSYIIKGMSIPAFQNNVIDDKMGIWTKPTYDLINRIAVDLSLPKMLIDQFLRSLYSLTRTGKIDKRKFNPNYDKILSSVGTLPTEQSVFDNIQNTILPNVGKTAKVIAVIAVLGIGAFVFHDFTQIKKRV